MHPFPPCCCSKYLQELTRGFEDPTLLMSGDAEKEVARASKLLGPEWVTQVKKRCDAKPTALTRGLMLSRFMERARMTELDFSDDMEQDIEATCPKCGDCEYSS